MEQQKTIAICPFNGRRHSLYEPTIKILSEKYNLIGYELPKEKSSLRLFSNPLIKIFYYKFIRRFLSKNDLEFKEEKDSNCDLIFACNQLPHTEKNYILDMEILTALSGYDYNRLDKKKIQIEFEKENCKAIIVWTKFSYDCLIENIDCRKFKNKIYILPPTINSTKIIKESNRKTINLLFVSSLINPFDFEVKGGKIVLEVYSKLVKKYPNLTLKIRSPISHRLKKKYSKVKGISFIEEFLSREELEKLFLESDILLEPAPGVSLLLECMNFQIPLVLADYATIKDFVKEDKTAFIIKIPQINKDNKDKIDFLKNNQENYLRLYRIKIDKKVINSFVEKTEKLIEDKSLRIKMGVHAKTLLNGEFSLEKRNKKILEIVKNALPEK